MDAKRFQAVYYAARLLHPKVKVTARIPLAVATQETSLGTAGVGVSCNNLFGMNKPVLRKTTATGANAGGLAIFNSHESSILDYVIFLEQLGMYTDDLLAKYIKDLKYNRNPAYPGKIDRIIAQQMPTIIPPAQFVAVASASAIGVICGIKLVATLFNKLS
jgi:flagellum-specific peptidoglycan hydrolase FlgJ